MQSYLLNRLWQSAVTLLLATVVVFLGVRALPGDPALAFAGEERDAASLAAIRARYGFDEPVLVQYGKFLAGALRGDLGQSTRTGIPVTEMIGTSLPVTVQLSVMALLVAVVLGGATGVVAAVRRGRPAE